MRSFTLRDKLRKYNHCRSDSIVSYVPSSDKSGQDHIASQCTKRALVIDKSEDDENEDSDGEVQIVALLKDSLTLDLIDDSLESSPPQLMTLLMVPLGSPDVVYKPPPLEEVESSICKLTKEELQSSDITKAEHTDPTLFNFLKTSFTSSNISVAFPYVEVSDGKSTLENSLILGFVENCRNGLGVNHIAYLESCSVDGENLKKLRGLQSLENIQDFVGSRMETGVSGKTDLIVFCDEGVQEMDQAPSEGKTLSELVNFLEKSGATYTVLYASDPYRSLQYPPHLAVRFLAENNFTNSTLCDGVCQIKSSLLEGLFVGIVLLIIVISGLCCMMGIDTPTRFEAPQES